MSAFLKECLRIRNMHLFFPYLVGIICVFLLVVLSIQRAMKCRREHKPFINFEGWQFFEENYDKVKLWGTLILCVLYIIALPRLHFVAASMIFIFLFNVLFDKKQGEPFKFSSLIVSALIAVISSVGIWYLFFKIFNITLP